MIEARVVESIELRKHVLGVVAHVQAAGPFKVHKRFAAKVRDLYAKAMPVLRRFAAGDGAADHDLYLAIRAIETAVFVTGTDDALLCKVMLARECCVKLAGPGVGEADGRFVDQVAPGLFKAERGEDR